MRNQTRDRQILRFVSETPWAILPSALRQIQQIVAFHASGGRLTADELAARLDAAARPRSNGSTPPSGIAVLSLWGSIVPHADVMTEMSGGTAIDTWRAQFEELAADPSIGTIVLNVDSPGGAVDLVSETAAAIREARKTTHVVAVANTMAASAAYWLSSQADDLYVSPSGQVGSIGVYMAHQDLSGMLEQEGVKMTLISAGEHKVDGNPFEPLSDETRAHLQTMVNESYRSFVADVAAGREVDVSTVEASYGQGRMFMAKQALAAGMVDGIASLDQVIGRLVSGKRPNGARALAAANLPVTVAESFGVFATGNEVSLNGLGNHLDLTFTTTPGIQISAGTPAASAAPSRTARSASATTTKEDTMDTVTDGGPLTREELLAEQAEIKKALDDLDEAAAGRKFTAEEEAEDTKFQARLEEITELVAHMDERTARRRERAGEIAGRQPREQFRGDGGNGKPDWDGRTNTNRRGPENIFDLGAYGRHVGDIKQIGPLWAEGAKRANEIVRYNTDHKDETRAFVDKLIRISEHKFDSHESFGHRLLLAGDPSYEETFGRWVMGRATGRDMDRIRGAITESGLGSETPVPVTIDPTVLYSGDGSRDPLRQLARVVTITGLTWRGISSEGITMSYGAEASAFSPQTPSFDAPDVTVEKAKGEIQFTVEVDTDWPSLREELQLEFTQAKTNLEATKFMNGTGSDEPTGVMYALVTDGSSLVPTSGVDAVTLDDVTNTADDLPASFDANAAWLAHKRFYTFVSALARAEGVQDPWTNLVPGVAPTNPLVRGNLHGYPAYAHSEISYSFSESDAYVAIVGDFERGFVIVDRAGLNVEFDPHPRDGNGAWLGQRALLAWFRNNTALRTPNAFRVIKVKGT